MFEARYDKTEKEMSGRHYTVLYGEEKMESFGEDADSRREQSRMDLADSLVLRAERRIYRCGYIESFQVRKDAVVVGEGMRKNLAVVQQEQNDWNLMPKEVVAEWSLTTQRYFVFESSSHLQPGDELHRLTIGLKTFFSKSHSRPSHPGGRFLRSGHHSFSCCWKCLCNRTKTNESTAFSDF